MINVFYLLFSALRTSRLRRRKAAENARHAKRSWKRRRRVFSFSHAVLALTLAFLFVPLVVIIVYSFNESKGASFTRLSLVWYRKLLFDSRPLWDALLNSVIVAVTSAIMSTLLGTLAAIGINWYDFRGKHFISTVTYMPMILPEVIVGVSTLIFFSGIHLPLGLFTIFAAHTTFCLPFVFLMVKARLDEFDLNIVEAARDLGATETQAMLRVVIPSLIPGIVSGFFMAITMSMEDFVITFFVSGPGSTTLPLYVYSMIRFGVSPVINSLSAVVMAATCLIAFCLRGTLKTVARNH